MRGNFTGFRRPPGPIQRVNCMHSWCYWQDHSIDLLGDPTGTYSCMHACMPSAISWQACMDTRRRNAHRKLQALGIPPFTLRVSRVQDHGSYTGSSVGISKSCVSNALIGSRQPAQNSSNLVVERQFHCHLKAHPSRGSWHALSACTLLG